MVERRATLKDVAAASGVSPTTVSFVLNRTPGQSISAGTRDLVEAAARELGYSPHGLARALREGTSRLVLLSVDRRWDGGSLAGFVRGLREELGTHGYDLVVQAEEEARSGAAAAGRSLAGLRPFAVLDLIGPYAEEDDGADGGWVDGLAAHSLLQIEHLLEQGHEHIALARPERLQEDRVNTARLRYAHESADRLGLPSLQEVTLRPDAPQAAAALAALTGSSPAITALAGFDDATALAALAAMSDLGLSAPRDLAVIGFDEGHHAALWRPALTTVRIEAETFGRRAARSVLGLDLGDWPGPPSSVVRRQTA